MGRQRDPKRDEAKDIYKAAKGEIGLTEIAAQLGVSDGTVRGWKAKDKWENLLTGEVIETERSVKSKGTKRNVPIEDNDEADREQDELFISAVKIVAEAKQASVSLLQRRLRIGFSRAARLIDAMEKKKLIGPYQGDKPREVYATPDTVGVLERETPTKRNAPKKQLERSVVSERSETMKLPAKETEPELPEIPDDEGLTPKNRIFVMEYLRDFNATRAAIATGYSKKTAYSIGWELLRKPEIISAIQRHTAELTVGLGLDIRRIIAEYMKIAFADITDYVEFGQKDEQYVGEDGKALLNDETGEPLTYKRNFVAFKNADEIDGTLINEVKQGKDGVSVKLYDKMRALKELEKYTGYLTEFEKAKLEKVRLEVEKLKNGDGDSEDELIEDWVGAVIGDEEDGDEEETSGI